MAKTKVQTFLDGLTDDEKTELFEAVSTMTKPKAKKGAKATGTAVTTSPGPRTGTSGDGLAMLKSLRRN